MNIFELKESLEAKRNRQEEIMNGCVNTDGTERDFTDAENTEFDSLTADIRTLTAKISEAEKRQAAKDAIVVQKAGKRIPKSPENEVAERFSFAKIIKNLAAGRPLDGLELEMTQEAERESAIAGIQLEGGVTRAGFALPSFMMRAGQDAATAATAGNLVATELDPNIIPALAPKLKLTEMGAMYMPNLVGKLDLPAGDGLATATWEGELDANANTDPSTRLISLRPSRLAARTDISSLLLKQTNGVADTWVRGELSNAVSKAVETAAYEGNGGSISGILSTANVNAVALAAATPTRAELISMYSLIQADNAEAETMYYVISPSMGGTLNNLATDAGSGIFVHADGQILGYKTKLSNLITAGNLYFGDFTNIILASWGGVDFIVDPYTLASTGQIRITTNSYWDVKLRHAQAFTKATYTL